MFLREYHMHNAVYKSCSKEVHGNKLQSFIFLHPGICVNFTVFHPVSSFLGWWGRDAW